VYGDSLEPVGACCVMDYRPRRWSTADLAMIADGAQLATTVLTSAAAPDVPSAARRVDNHRDFLDALLDSLMTGVMACDADGRLVLINRAMREVYAVPEGSPPSRWAHHVELRFPDGRAMATDEIPLARALHGERVRDVEVLVKRPGVRSRLFVANGRPIIDERGHRLGAVLAMHDMTDQRQADRFKACELAVAKVLAEAASAAQAGRQVLQAVAATLGWPHAELWLLDETHGVLRPAATWTDPSRKPIEPPAQLAEGVGLAGAAWKLGEAVWIPDIAAAGDLIGDAVAVAKALPGLHAALAIPVLSANRTLGVLTVFADIAEEPRDALIALLSGIAAHVGQFLERRRAEELLLQLAQSKDEYIALVGHELRTPLTSIAAYTQLLLDAEDEMLLSEGRSLLGVVRRNNDQLRRIIDDLLDMAALDAGHATIHPQPTDLGQLLAEGLAAIEPAAADKHLMFNAKVAAGVVVSGDHLRLRQVIDNVLSNAVKYTPEGGRVDIGLQPTADGAILTISDTGIGIPSGERHRVFQRFFRSSLARNRGIPGTGLGLAITRTIVQRHHGTITLTHREDGPGTTVTIRIPTAQQ
jgi:signal transduction histidine kinase/PAS domain-containing protein